MTGRIVLFGAGLLVLTSCGQEVKMLELEPMSTSFTKRSQSEKLEVKAQDIRGGTIPNIPIKFRSSNAAVATVDPDGTIRPAGDGSTFIVAEAPNGVTGESHVKVCLPKQLSCEPAAQLDLKVGTTGPIRCEITDCNDEKIQGKIEFKVQDETIARPYEGDEIFVGLAVGDTEITAKAFEFERTIKIHVEEQEFLPGMGPGSGAAPKRRGGGKGEKDPYGGGGRFNHIIDNMKFN